MQFVLVGAIEGIDARQEVEAALGASRLLLGFRVGIKQQNVGDGWSVIGIVDLHVHGLHRQGFATVHILDADFHLILAVGQRETLLVDERAIEFCRIGHHWAIQGNLGESADLFLLAEDGLYLHGSLESTRFKLLIYRGTVVDGDGIFNERGHARDTISRCRKIRLQAFGIHLGIASQGHERQHDNYE